MATRPAPKHVVLIIARQFADELAVPVFLTDAEGNLVYYNEAAEVVLGRSFAEAGEIVAADWRSLFAVTDLEGRPMDLAQMPGGIALLERRPAHGTLCIVGLDEVRRSIEVTALPLLAHREELVGVLIVFWPV